MNKLNVFEDMVGALQSFDYYLFHFIAALRLRVIKLSKMSRLI